jgi:hypothetical protein
VSTGYQQTSILGTSLCEFSLIENFAQNCHPSARHTQNTLKRHFKFLFLFDLWWHEGVGAFPGGFAPWVKNVKLTTTLTTSFFYFLL